MSDDHVARVRLRGTDMLRRYVRRRIYEQHWDACIAANPLDNSGGGPHVLLAGNRCACGAEVHDDGEQLICVRTHTVIGWSPHYQTTKVPGEVIDRPFWSPVMRIDMLAYHRMTAVQREAHHRYLNRLREERLGQ